MKTVNQLKLKENEKKALLELEKRLSQKFPDSEIVLYGSKARGDSNEESDIDVLILTRQKVDSRIRDEIVGLAYDIELDNDVVFGLLIESKEFWNSPLAKAMPIHWNIDGEGIRCMNEKTCTIVRYRLERAKESLDSAKKLLSEGNLHSSVNRIYYSMFYSVTALLLTEGLSSSKHSGVKSLFFREFVNTGRIDRKYGKLYSQIFEKRQAGDYKDFIEFEEKDVKDWLEKAADFVKALENSVLGRIGGKSSRD